MKRAGLLLLLSVAACAPGAGEEWPSLALRPGEAQTLVARPTAGLADGASPATPVPPPALRDAAARLATLDRDTAAYDKRLRAQLAATAAARAARDGDAATTAELERTRLDRLGAQAGDLRDRYDALAGDLARQAAAGGDVGELLAGIGRGIDRVEALRTEQMRAAAGAAR